MPNYTTKTSSTSRLSQYQYRHKERDKKTMETAGANKPAKPDVATVITTSETGNNMEERLQATVESNGETSNRWGWM